MQRLEDSAPQEEPKVEPAQLAVSQKRIQVIIKRLQHELAKEKFLNKQLRLALLAKDKQIASMKEIIRCGNSLLPNTPRVQKSQQILTPRNLKTTMSHREIAFRRSIQVIPPPEEEDKEGL